MTRPSRTNQEKRKYGSLWNACDVAYYWTYDRIPSGIKDNLSERKVAFSLGFLSGYGAAEVGASVAYPIANNVAESLGTNLPSLETIASHALVGTATIPLGAKLIAPGKYKEWKDLHPRYSAGVFGVMAGASIRALQEIVI